MQAETKDKEEVHITRKGEYLQRVCVKDFSSFDSIWGEMEESQRPKVLVLSDFLISADEPWLGRPPPR